MLPILALIASGLTWTTAGYLKDWRKNHNNPDWKGFDKKSLRNDLLLGAFLGGGAVLTSAALGQTLPAITTINEFVIAVSAGFGLVAAFDKYVIGFVFGK